MYYSLQLTLPRHRSGVGTNAGIIYVFSLSVPTGENREHGKVNAELSKSPWAYCMKLLAEKSCGYFFKGIV